MPTALAVGAYFLWVGFRTFILPRLGGGAGRRRRRTSARTGQPPWSSSATERAAPEKAPGYLDPRAAGFDAAVRACTGALATGRRRTRPALGTELLAAGVPAWHADQRGCSSRRYRRRRALRRGAPYGVGLLRRTVDAIVPGRASSPSSARPRPASPTSPSRSPSARRRDRQRRLDAALRRDGHRHGQAAGGRARRRRRTTCSTSGRSPKSAAVAEYQALARAAIAEIAGRGRVPILVGGSGLYVRGALDGLEFPGESAEVRARLYAELAERRARARCTRGSPRLTPRRPRRSCRRTAAASSARWRSSS